MLVSQQFPKLQQLREFWFLWPYASVQVAGCKGMVPSLNLEQSAL